MKIQNGKQVKTSASGTPTLQTSPITTPNEYYLSKTTVKKVKNFGFAHQHQGDIGTITGYQESIVDSN